MSRTITNNGTQSVPYGNLLGELAVYKSMLAGVALVAVLGLVAANWAAEDFVIRKGNASPKSATPKPAAAAEKPAAAAPLASTKPSSAKSRKPQAIKLALKSGESPADAWNRYFAALKPVDEKDSVAVAKRADLEQDVRQSVRDLMSTQKFDQVIGLIEAALRNGHPQPWMYQALGLALTAAKAPSAQIERALMSAVDFAGSDTTQLAYIAHYMARNRLDGRALRIFRQVADLEPTRPEPYIHGLAIAQRLDDRDAMEWAILGILSQAWPRSQEHIERDATNQASALLERLNKEGRTREAQTLRAKINAALERDVVVQVSWTGQADLDISVQEPTGTTCSFRNPRTTAGGVILGDSFAGQQRKSGDSYTETYVCSKAFAGRYQMLIRKVWGEVTADQVKVKITMRRPTRTEKDGDNRVASIAAKEEGPIVIMDTADLDEGTNFVQFALENGRRTEPLSDVQVANAIREQQALGREILAQQVGGLDAGALQSLAASRALAGNGNGVIPGILPIPVGGAVGFRPVITTLPEGANLAATAVISADRRYVRITALPLFSKIGKVLAFNIITGRITDGNPDVGANAGAGGGGGGGAPGPGGPGR
jgi:hypothetical protein